MTHAFAKARKLSVALGRPVPVISGVSIGGASNGAGVGGLGGVYLREFGEELEKQGFVSGGAAQRVSLYPSASLAYSDNLLGWTPAGAHEFRILHRLGGPFHPQEHNSVINHAASEAGTFPVQMRQSLVALPTELEVSWS